MRRNTSTLSKRLLFSLTIFAAFSVAASSLAQSTDVTRPTPVTRNEIGGRIVPRDIGDARLTRHFYAFNGAEGDLILSVESRDFNGDVDVFTASTMRPLLKITLFGGPAVTRVSKGVYLRVDEPLILRVEGRAVADADAQYRIIFEGAFRPASGAFAQVEEGSDNAESSASSESRKGRRATSSGARIEEPVVEAAAQPEKEEAQPAPAAVETPAEPSRANTGTSSRTPSRRGARRNRPSGASTSRTTPAPTTSPSAESAEAEKSTEEKRAEESTATKAPARPSTARNTRRGGRGATRTARTEEPRATDDATAAAPPKETTAAQSELGTRLVIVTKDGETIERDMSTVRRVTVERGQIVVIGTDGKVTRQPLSNVLRMAIEP